MKYLRDMIDIEDNVVRGLNRNYDVEDIWGRIMIMVKKAEVTSESIVGNIGDAIYETF